MTIAALTHITAAPPTMHAGSCPAGSGAVTVARRGSAGAIVTGTLNGSRPDRLAVRAGDRAPVSLSATTTISACAAAGGAVPAPGSGPAPMSSLMGLLAAGLL